MTRRTIDNVIEEIDEWQSRYGDFMYTVKAFFTNKEFVRATKKSKDAALELRGLLMESAQRPHEFILEADGVSKAGNPKWKLLAFGPIEGTYTYSTLKDGQGAQSSASGSRVSGGDAVRPGVSAVSVTSAPTNNVDASIRASVAIKAAASWGRGLVLDVVFVAAERIDEWLAMKSSGVTPQGSPEDTGVEPGTGEGLGSTPTKWQERVETWPKD